MCSTCGRHTVEQRRNGHIIAHYSRNESGNVPKEASVFDAVYWGQAIGEVLYERLNSLAADALAEFGKSEAEFRKNLSDITMEVEARANRAMLEAKGISAGQSSLPSRIGSGETVAARVDVGEAADNLRAEIASTRAVLQRIKRSS